MGRKYVVGITDERLKDRRFRRIEDAILQVVLEGDYYISPGEMAEKIGVARSTIYRHHKTMRGILLDYQEYILSKYKCLVKIIEGKKGIYTRAWCERVLLFILQYKQIFEMLLKGREVGVLKDMVRMLEPMIAEMVKLPKNHEKMFLVYMNEVVGLVERWIEEGCDDKEIEILMRNVVYLTDTMRLRLKGLMAN